MMNTSNIQSTPLFHIALSPVVSSSHPVILLYFKFAYTYIIISIIVFITI